MNIYIYYEYIMKYIFYLKNSLIIREIIKIEFRNKAYLLVSYIIIKKTDDDGVIKKLVLCCIFVVKFVGYIPNSKKFCGLHQKHVSSNDYILRLKF